jgi:hypothetical protein
VTLKAHARLSSDDDDSDDSDESEGEGESGEKASSPEVESRNAGFGFIVPDDNGDQADKATDGEASKHDDHHAHEKKVGFPPPHSRVLQQQRHRCVRSLGVALWLTMMVKT